MIFFSFCLRVSFFLFSLVDVKRVHICFFQSPPHRFTSSLPLITRGNTSFASLTAESWHGSRGEEYQCAIVIHQTSPLCHLPPLGFIAALDHNLSSCLPGTRHLHVYDYYFFTPLPPQPSGADVSTAVFDFLLSSSVFSSRRMRRTKC